MNEELLKILYEMLSSLLNEKLAVINAKFDEKFAALERKLSSLEEKITKEGEVRKNSDDCIIALLLSVLARVEKSEQRITKIEKKLEEGK